ncbi:MAG TPA: hypothetical protein PK777_13020 [Thermoguttaceae bacterium]|nr:hypothetical protein [Thermoguttaceae bacterium]
MNYRNNNLVYLKEESRPDQRQGGRRHRRNQTNGGFCHILFGEWPIGQEFTTQRFSYTPLLPRRPVPMRGGP